MLDEACNGTDEEQQACSRLDKEPWQSLLHSFAVAEEIQDRAAHQTSPSTAAATSEREGDADLPAGAMSHRRGSPTTKSSRPRAPDEVEIRRFAEPLVVSLAVLIARMRCARGQRLRGLLKPQHAPLITPIGGQVDEARQTVSAG